MTPYQTLAVTVRLFAIWLFLYYISSAFGTYAQASQYDVSNAQMRPIFWSLGILVLICVLLWFFPLYIAKKILPLAAVSAEQSATFSDWFSVGCSLIGLWVLADAIPALVGYSLNSYFTQVSLHDNLTLNSNWAIKVYFHVFKLVMGVWLFLGGKGLRKIFGWVRHA